MRNCEYDDAELAACDGEETDEAFVFRRVIAVIVFAATIISSVFGALLFSLAHTPAQASAEPAPTPSQNLSPAEPVYTREPDMRKRVLIDAGHGGFDPGTAGTDTGVYESTVNLQIAQKLEKVLESKGYCVLMTRTDENALAAGKDDDMQARCEMIKRSNADVFISIHQNAFDEPDTCGCEVYYHETRPESRTFAECVEREMAKIPDAKPSRGVKAYGHMLTKFIDNSILIECGFITNPYEEAHLVDEEYQMRIAEAIAKGVDTFFDTNYKN